MGVSQVRITKQSQKWRYRCPNGHTSWEMTNNHNTSWEMTNNHMWCRACANQLDVDPEFWELYDQKTGETVPREEIVLKA